MALPTAQLGQMASLNVPSYVPTTVVNKEPKAWERALLGLLTNVASGVATKGTENMMTGDSAAEFGQTPNSGFSKFWNGPAIGDKEAAQRRQLALDQEKADESASSARKDRMLTRTGQNLQQSRVLGQQALETEQAANTLLHQGATEDLQATELQQTGLHQHLQDLVARIDAQRRGSYYEGETKLGQDRLAQERARQTLIDEREAPWRAAQGREYNARASKEEGQNQMIQNELQHQKGMTSKAGSAVKADFAPVAPELQRSRAAIEQRLQTPQYPTAEQIMARPSPSLVTPHEGSSISYGNAKPDPELIRQANEKAAAQPRTNIPLLDNSWSLPTVEDPEVILRRILNLPPPPAADPNAVQFRF